MAKRLFLVGLLAGAFACGTTRTGDKESKMSRGSRAAASEVGRDAIERALLSLGIDGRVLRVDLNEADWEGGRIRVARTHLLGGMLLLEGTGKKPRVYSLNRNGLQPRWVSELQEPTAFRVAESPGAVLLTSEHYVHALEKDTGRRAMQFVGGSLDGLRRPALLLPFMATGGAAGQNDTLYVPSLGSSVNNKTIESFSMVTGARGWGYRTSSEILTSPEVGGSAGDPKLYFVTRTGHVTCIDASNYGYAPSGPAWEELLEAGVDHDLFLTPDRRGEVGALYLVDKEGVVYCLDRITGNRRWTIPTQRRPVEGPKVFGEIAVVKMSDGLVGFDKDNLLYSLSVIVGPDQGASTWVRNGSARTVGSADTADLTLTDRKIGAVHLTLEVQGGVLVASTQGGGRMQVDGGAPTNRAVLHQGSEVAIGGTVLRVRDRGTAALWTDLKYDRIVAKVGDMLVAEKAGELVTLHAWTGQETGEWVDFGAARFIPTNPRDGNLFVVAGDAVVYALFAR